MRLAAALARFQTQLQAKGCSQHTAAQYARHVRRFASWLDAEDLPDDLGALFGAATCGRVKRASHQPQRGCGLGVPLRGT